MNSHTHRKQVVTGLRGLADFLREYNGIAKLNSAMSIDATYHVLERDTEKARDEFTGLAEFLAEHADDSCSFDCRQFPHKQTMQHSASLLFGDGAVTYRVLWIEPLEAEDDNDD
jgi:hypothetical protein